MASPRDGTVLLSMPDGRAVPLRFTWRAIDMVGAGGVGELIDKAGSGQPGDMTALATLVQAATNGQIKVEDLLDGDAPPFSATYVLIVAAWTEAMRKPQGEGGAAGANPLTRLLTSLKRLWGRLTQRG